MQICNLTQRCHELEYRYKQIGHDLCSYKHNFCQKGITDNRSQKIHEPETGAFDLIKLIGLNLPKDCDITQSKITKLNNFIVFTHNFFCPGILLGYVD